MNIRKVKKKDYKEVNKMLVSLHNYHAKNRPDIFSSIEKFYTKKEYKKDIKESNIYYIAEENNDILGIIGFTFIKRNKKLCLKVNTLYVKEEHRNENIATKLMKKVVKLFRKKAKENPEKYKDSIELSVFSFNKNASSFYEKFGFVERYRCLEYKKEA